MNKIALYLFPNRHLSNMEFNLEKKIVGLVSSQTNYFRTHQIGEEMMLGNDPI